MKAILASVRIFFAVFLTLSTNLVLGQAWGGATDGQGDIYRQGKVGLGIMNPDGYLDIWQKEIGWDDPIFLIRAGDKESVSAAGLYKNLVQVTKRRVMIGGVDRNVTNLISTDIELAVGGGAIIGSRMITDRPRIGYKLLVGGKMLAEEIKVDRIQNWPDYVFADAYKLRSPADLEQYIQTHRHLPGIPSASQVAEDGIYVGEMQALLLEKIEELTLYVIDQNKKIAALEEAMSQQENW